MSSDNLTVEGVSATAVHEAAHVVVHLKEYGTFRYVTLRSRSAESVAHVYGVSGGSPATLMAGPIAEAMYDGTVARVGTKNLMAHMHGNGGCDDIQMFFEDTNAADTGFWLERTIKLVGQHWDTIITLAALLERHRTLTSRQVRIVLAELSKEAV
ncbi:hypothetical protein ACFV2E_08190 [Streptomyces globisporus]|uniref:hypothetical protein n=1 Tax=Streptomyces globisporus TaxID=1908 RepID=UPI003681B292